MNHLNQEKGATNVSFSPLLNFFIFCSAADKNIFSAVPPRSVINIEYWATVFLQECLPVCLAVCLYTVLIIWTVAIGLGYFWGALVFNLDRFIVSTIKKSEKRFGQLKQITPRLLLASFWQLWYQNL